MIILKCQKAQNRLRELLKTDNFILQDNKEYDRRNNVTAAEQYPQNEFFEEYKGTVFAITQRTQVYAIKMF